MLNIKISECKCLTTRLQTEINESCRYGTVNCQVEVPIVVEELRKVKDRFLTLSAFMSLEDFASGWFLGATLDEVKRGNAEAFVAYSMYCRRKEDLSEEVWVCIAG